MKSVMDTTSEGIACGFQNIYKKVIQAYKNFGDNMNKAI